MPNTERTFADRLQRARDVQAGIAVFSPAFAPTDTTLAPVAFLAFLDALDTQNVDTGVMVGAFSTAVAVRTEQVADIKDRAGRVLAYVKSNVAWKKFLPAVKGFVDKIRNNRAKPPKPPTPAETPGSPTAVKRNKGEQGFGDIEMNFDKLIGSLAVIPGYAPPAAEISIASLTTLSTNYTAQNAAMATLGQELGIAQRDRLAAYDGPGGLREKLKAIKDAVRSQYGTNSAEYGQVKGIGL